MNKKISISLSSTQRNFIHVCCVVTVVSAAVCSVDAKSLIPYPTPKPDYTGSIINAAAVASKAKTLNQQELPPRLVPFPIARPHDRSITSPKTATQTANIESFQAPSTKGASIAPLKAFFAAFSRKDGPTALRLKESLSHPLDRKIAAWMIATTSTRNFSHQTLKQNAAEVSNWPGQASMRLARERTLAKAGHASLSVAKALPNRPATDEGKLLQIKSLVVAGQRNAAAERVRDYWVSENFTAGIEQKILRNYGTLLKQSHHKARADRLLYDDRASGALRLLPYLTKSDGALVNARVAVIRRQANAGRLLDALPAGAKREPGYFFSRAQHLRRADKWVAAGKLIAAAPKNPSSLTDPDEWWVERRMISRKVLEAGHPKLAYKIAAENSAPRLVSRVDGEFHAGWYALRFLKDPTTALRHFETIRRLSAKPLSQSRALYWIARAHDALGNRNDASRHYQAAGQHAQTYYGQLALRALGRQSIALPALPSTNKARARFEQNGFVQVIRRLNEAGQKGRTGIFYRHLAQAMKDPAEITLLASLADENRLYPISLQIGKLALAQGVNVPRLAFPLGAIPKQAGISNANKALAYAIARQESAFNVGAVSSADARGLMQLLPTTAKITARSIGISYQPAKLTTDGAYNARLGSAFLNQLIDRFGGSYILAFAGYNAGPRRSEQWIKRFGDPRRNAIDAIDWVEAIPFAETRNYVQRVMENLQVYRHRLENAPLTIKRDLNQGHPA